MVILGLGTNVGDRLASLRRGLKLIKAIPDLSVMRVSPVYQSDALMPENAPASWDLPFLNLAISCETRLTPHELLIHLKQIEVELGRKPDLDWAPRPLDIDILAWDDIVFEDEKLQLPHEFLYDRPFALFPLADIAPRWIYPVAGEFQGKTATEIADRFGSRLNGEAPLHTKQILQRIDTPQLVGIINVTPESFSDGGHYQNVNAAIQQAYALVEGGAEILDIGAEATNPKASPIDPKTEWQRLEPILIGILAESTRMLITPKISIDTRHAEVAKKALDLGVDWINDVSGLQSAEMCELLSSYNNDIVIMHQLGLPVSQSEWLPSATDPVPVINQWIEATLKKCAHYNIDSSRIITDIGIGFGKNAHHSLELLQQIETFKQFHTRLLVGHSRKSFLTQFTEAPAKDRDIETVVISLFLAKKEVDYLRIHNPELHTRALKAHLAISPLPLWERSPRSGG